MDPDDAEYRKSVRNMSLVLAAIVVTIFAAIFVSPYAFPSPNTFQTSVSSDSAQPFTLHLQVNTTSVPAGGGIMVSGWLNGTSASIQNITASDGWAVSDQGYLVTRACTSGWPIGVGLMRGHYTQGNVTLGELLPVAQPELQCPLGAATPGYFLLEPHSSKALVDLGGSPAYWVLQSGFSYSASRLPAGVYTAVLADEWGDLVLTNFVVA